MKNTKIEWTDHTVNFWWGCSKISPACQFCYAETVANVFGKPIFGRKIGWGKGVPRAERLKKAIAECMAIERKAEKSGRRFKVFVNSMSDWLDDEVPIEWLTSLLSAIHACPNLDFQLLTKRPENWKPRLTQLLKTYDFKGPQFFLGWLDGWLHYKKPPTNVWIGTTIENQAMANLRHAQLMRIPARIHFWSAEPLLSAIDARDLWARHGRPSWVICGGESGKHARPMHRDWARSLWEQCQGAGVPFFFKQWGEWIPCGQHQATPPPEKTKPELLHSFSDGTYAFRVGKEGAGRLLDGNLHTEFPTVS